MNTRTILLFIAILALAFTASAATFNVTVASFSFTPRNITVSQGDTVIWTNTGGTHNVHETSTPAVFFSGQPSSAHWTYTWVVETTPAGQYSYVCDLHASMTGTVTVIPVNAVDDHSPIANGFELLQNYPNPFNSQTNIEFALPVSGHIELTVFNVLGEKVSSLYSGEMSAGAHSFTFDASNMTTGLYMYQLKTPSGMITRSMMYLR